MEQRRDRLERIAQERLKTVRHGRDACVEVGGPANMLANTPQGPAMIEGGFCVLLTLGHNLLKIPPITVTIVVSADTTEQQVGMIVDQLLEAADDLRMKAAKIPDVPADNALGQALRQNPVKLG